MPRYRVRVLFTFEGDVYGSEIYEVSAPDESAARTEAIKISDDSDYADDRIDFVREVRVLGIVEEG